MKNSFTIAGVMGWPVAHSRSPLIHNHWLHENQLNGAYGLFPVSPDKLEAAIRGIQALGLAGCNITIPHKVNAMSYVDYVHPLAQRMGAINTIVVQADGSLHGFNNDGFGYIQSLRDAKPDWRGDAGPVLVLGAGGAARAVVLSLLDEGAPEVRLINRTRSKAEDLAALLGDRVKVFDWSERNDAMAELQKSSMPRAKFF